MDDKKVLDAAAAYGRRIGEKGRFKLDEANYMGLRTRLACYIGFGQGGGKLGADVKSAFERGHVEGLAAFERKARTEARVAEVAQKVVAKIFAGRRAENAEAHVSRDELESIATAVYQVGFEDGFNAAVASEDGPGGAT